MKILVDIKAIGRKKVSVEQQTFELENIPSTVRELINEMVCICVERFKQRAEGGAVLAAMTKDEVSDAAASGKISFGEINGNSDVDVEKARNNALQCFVDGIYRIFLDEKPLEDVDEKIELCENSTLTFVRLTMLAGRLW